MNSGKSFVNKNTKARHNLMGTSKISLETENIARRLTKALSGDEAVKQLFEAEMGIDQSVVRKLLSEALRSGGDFADLHFEYSTRNSVVMEDGIIKNSAVAVVSGVGFRVVKDDQTGYAYSEDFDLKPMIHAARTAASIASVSYTHLTLPTILLV